MGDYMPEVNVFIPKKVYCVFYCKNKPVLLDIFVMNVLEAQHSTLLGWDVKLDREVRIRKDNIGLHITEALDTEQWIDVGNDCFCYYTFYKDEAVKQFNFKLNEMSEKAIKLQNEVIEINSSMLIALQKLNTKENAIMVGDTLKG